jgi:hypothetical protein
MMTANELADELEVKSKTAEDHGTIANRAKMAAAMIRQQQAEIEALKKTIDSLFSGLDSSLALNKAQAERNNEQ